MPDANGALSTDDFERIKQWFATRWNGAVICPVCKTSDWTYGTHVVKMVRHADDSYAPGTIVFPYIPVHCKTCAHTMLFGAAVMGVSVPVRPPMPTLPRVPLDGLLDNLRKSGS